MKTTQAKQNTGTAKVSNTPFFSPKIGNSFFAPSSQLAIQNKQSERSNTSIQMQTEEEEEPIQSKMPLTLQFQEEEEELQAKSDVQFQEEEEELIQAKTETGVQNSSVHQLAKSGFMGSSGAYPFFHQIQHSFGYHDISSISSYNNTAANLANQRMGSLAYTSGNKVAFKNSPSLHTAAHEAAHVVQQRKGVNLKSGLGMKGDEYEQHADAVANKVVQGKSAESLLARSPANASHFQKGSIQFTNTSAGDDLGSFWDMHVNPGNHPGAIPGQKNTGKQVRSFQRLHGRSTHSEEGQRIVDINDRGLASNQTLTDSEQITEPESTGSREWDIDLVTHELFDPTPELADVMQGSIGDCYLLATLQSMSSTGGGQTQLTNAINETSSGYSVQFFRPQVIGGRAMIDATSRVRVNIGRGYDPRGVQLREKSESMSDADARQLLIDNGYESQLQDSDTVTVWWTKRIAWPWAVERAYASVAGGLDQINGGFAALPVMVLTGEVPRHIFDFAGFSIADIVTMFNSMNALVDNDTIITSGTYNNLDTIYGRTFFVQAADETNGLRFIGADGLVTDWIPWEDVRNYIASFTIMDPLGIAEGRPLVSTKADYPDWEQALIDASSRSGVIIAGNFNTLCLGQGLILVPAHEYSITAVSATGAQTSNPWASLHPGLVSPAQFRRAFEIITFKG